MRRWDDRSIVPSFDGPIIFLVDWELNSEAVAWWPSGIPKCSLQNYFENKIPIYLT